MCMNSNDVCDLYQVVCVSLPFSDVSPEPRAPSVGGCLVDGVHRQRHTGLLLFPTHADVPKTHQVSGNNSEKHAET